MNFKTWLEYKDIDADSESKSVSALNMTANSWRPPKPGEGVLDQIPNLTRGFHLNTIIGRMMQPWSVGLNWAPEAYRLPSKMFANDQYKAAYDLFKQEIANTVHSLPHKEGLNINTQNPEDVLLATKKFLRQYQTEDKELIQSLQNAFNIFWKVFGAEYKNGIRNFVNFLEIVRDEFMTIGEMLPTMGNNDGRNKADTPLIASLEKEIDRYQRIEKTGKLK